MNFFDPLQILATVCSVVYINELQIFHIWVLLAESMSHVLICSFIPG